MPAEQEIIQRFLEIKRQVHPDVVEYLTAHEDPMIIDRIIAQLPSDAIVVSSRHIPGYAQERDGVRFQGAPLEVLSGGAGASKGKSSFEDFLSYFRDRYTRLAEMIRSRTSAVPIQALLRNPSYRSQKLECSIIAMVSEIRTTTNGHRLAEMEDSTGQISVLFNRERPVFADAERIVPDEVIGVKGSLSSDGKLFFAESIVRPDIPVNHAPYRSSEPGIAVFISDIHVGSDTFLEGEWMRFADWISDNEVQYLLVAGDLVDGIGIYPNQQEELTITDIYEQYRALGALLSDLPSHIQILLSPGNHDIVRGVEPQQAIPERFREGFPSNCIWVENPCMVSLQGVRVLMYHGRSIDDMIGLIPEASYSRPQQMMEEMLKRRHLALTYGKRVPLAAEKRDRLVIDHIPDVLHTGHVHTWGITRYRGVLGINAGAWQSQTSFQKQMNIQPTPARAVVLDLQTLETNVLDFSKHPETA
ncbi:MAG: DNA-directed DNA polymerase II small subunit [Methanomicrobiales archaeon]|nr:DNA-directed DNA polymerase II small subunit [Methanomicrobiales archaeon]